MGTRFHSLEDWFDSWRWYHWLVLLVLLWAFGYGGTRMGWIEQAPPGGWHPKETTPPPVQR